MNFVVLTRTLIFSLGKWLEAQRLDTRYQRDFETLELICGKKRITLFSDPI